MRVPSHAPLALCLLSPGRIRYGFALAGPAPSHVPIPPPAVEALQDVAPGAELTFFYPSTEWDMETPFDCCCGAAGCLGRIAGAKHLSDEQFAR